MPERGTCEFCTDPVLTSQRAAFRVRGWEIERAQGGANHIAGKERQSNRIVHARCLEAHLRYGAQEQMALGE